MCHFDLPGLRYEPETAEKYQKIDGRLTVLPAVQTRKVEIIKVAPPLKSSFCQLDDGQKKFSISALLAKVMKILVDDFGPLKCVISTFLA